MKCTCGVFGFSLAIDDSNHHPPGPIQAHCQTPSQVMGELHTIPLVQLHGDDGVRVYAGCCHHTTPVIQSATSLQFLHSDASKKHPRFCGAGARITQIAVTQTAKKWVGFAIFEGLRTKLL